jgi:Ca-activated chloride channel family protein
MLFTDAVAASAGNLETGKSFTHGLEAEGGTEMLPALKAALAGGGEGREGPVRQIIFLTDGSLSNEAEMMEEINRNRGTSRVFMIGIGSAPNTYLMRRMAEAGRGTFTHVGLGDEAEGQMQRLLDRLARPVATDLTASVEGGNIDFAPRDLPDLYAGEPLVMLGRTRHLAGTLTVSGLIDGRRWSQSIALGEASRSDVVARLWASRRIAEIEAERWSGEMDHDRADKSIEELGMAFHLVTSRTSLIAIDETPSRPAGAALTREELPLLLPAGWDFDHLFGGRAASAEEWQALADAQGEEEQRREQLDLPATATGYQLTLALGLLLLLAGGAGWVWWRRERLAQVPVCASLRQWQAA